MRLRRDSTWVAMGSLMGILVLHCGSEKLIGRDDSNGTGSPLPDSRPRITVFEPGELPDAGVTVPDDGGNETPDAGTPVPIPPETAGDWIHFGTEHNLPDNVRDVSADEAGNIWVAGYDALYLLRPGNSMFEKFTQAEGMPQWKVLSVAGMGPNEVIVGYEGVHGGLDDFDPEWMVKSGDADRVTLVGDQLQFEHFDISSPPSGSYPNGRDKIRDVYIIRPTRDGPYKGDIWFGANHGIAMWSHKEQRIFEHEHVEINGYNKAGVYTMLSGDWWGLAQDAKGNIWMGGSHRVGCLRYGDEGGDWWADNYPELDVWPDIDSRRDRTMDDYVQAITLDHSGRVYIGSLRHNLARYNPSTRNFRYWKDRSDGTPDRAVTALATDDDGSIWVGSWIGIGRYFPDSDDWIYYNVMTPGLPTDEIRSLQILTINGERKVFVGRASGISIYTGP